MTNEADKAKKRLSAKYGREREKRAELTGKLKEGHELPAKLKDITQQHVSDMVFLQEAHKDEVQNMIEANGKGIDRLSKEHAIACTWRRWRSPLRTPAAYRIRIIGILRHERLQNPHV
jgi:hypothetical protein